MGNALRDWGTAATLVAAALLQGGCKDSGNDELSKAARPIVSTPKLDLDATPNAVRDVLKAKAAAEEQPTVTETPADPPQVPQKKEEPAAEATASSDATATLQENIGQEDSEVTSDAMVAEIDGKKKELSLSPEYATQANERLFREYTDVFEKNRIKNDAAMNLLVAEHEYNLTKKNIIELGALSPPEYSDEDIAKIRSFLVEHQSYFTIPAQVYSRATKSVMTAAEIDKNYPDLSPSADRSVLTFTVVLSTTDGGPEAIDIPHTIRVSIELTKQGAKRDSVIIHNPFPANEGNFNPELYADRCISIFGERMGDTEPEQAK
ncbi:MAG: hypothetical protein AAB544_03355 [Patescibacteria group bacterium]